jgi:hypothetical protein
MTNHFNLRGDAPLDPLRALAVHAELAFDALQRALGGDAEDLRLSIRVFADGEEFKDFASIAGAEGAASFYDPRGAEAVVHCPGERARDGTVRLLRHEVTHLYMDRVFGRRDPLWLCEGLAEWLENASWENGRVVPGAENAAHLQTLRKALDSRTFIGLRRLISAKRSEFYAEERYALYYAEAWSLARFLAREPETLKALCAGKGLAEVADLAALEARWIESLKRE